MLNCLASGDRLFKSRAEWANHPQALDVFKGYATALAPDAPKFTACLNDAAVAQEIWSDFADGVRAGVSGTPTFYIYLPNVEWVQYFYEEYAFHRAYWHNNFGQPMSRGCVNIANEDAKWMFDWAGPVFHGASPTWQRPATDNPGTPVVVHE